MKILGIELVPKQPTDEEYVELVRKQIARSNWFGRLQVFFAVFYLGMFLLIWKLIYFVNSLFPDESGNFEDKGLIGIMIGAFAGLLLAFSIQSVVSAAQHYHGMRTERLLLKFHDNPIQKV